VIYWLELAVCDVQTVWYTGWNQSSFVGYLHILDLINGRKMDHVKPLASLVRMSIKPSTCFKMSRNTEVV